jgi:hypothetical protein
MMSFVLFPFNKFSGQCDHLPVASAKIKKELSYTATHSLPPVLHSTSQFSKICDIWYCIIQKSLLTTKWTKSSKLTF